MECQADALVRKAARFFVSAINDRHKIGICIECGRDIKIVASGKCSKCYSKAYNAAKRMLALQKRMFEITEAAKYLYPQPVVVEIAEPLTTEEEYIWDRSPYETIGQLRQKTGQTTEEIQRAFEHGLQYYRKARLNDLPMLKAWYEAKEKNEGER